MLKRNANDEFLFAVHTPYQSVQISGLAFNSPTSNDAHVAMKQCSRRSAGQGATSP